MQLISKQDLLILIPLIGDRDSFSSEDFELILDRFGDEWFMYDGVFKCITKNEEMAKIRKENENG